MTKAQVLAELFRLTGELFPVDPTTFEDLAILRRRLAESLFPLSGAGVSSAVPADPGKRPILDILKVIVDEAAADPGPPCRVLRRELTLRSALQPATFPSRSWGQAIVRTFGPMLENHERFVFFDLFEAAKLKPVDFGTVNSLLLLPGDAEIEEGTMSFGAGSVWIKASFFDATIRRGFVGLRVKSGTLEGSEADNWTLRVVLDPAPLESSPEGPGEDAGRALATRPERVVFKVEPTGMQIEASEAGLSLYGAATTLIRTDQPAVAWPQTGGVLVPFSSSERELRPTRVNSTILQPSGSWKLGRAGWLLSVSPPFLPPSELGEAADAGSVAIEIKDGLTLVWQGLAGGPYAASSATIAADSRDLSLVAEGRTPRIAQHQLALWRGSAFDLDLTTDFRLHFVSSRGGAEAFFAQVPLTSRLNRPLTADGRRMPVRFEAADVSLFSSQLLDSKFVALSGFRQVDASEIMSLALSNALLKVNPFDTLTLWGGLGEGGQVTNATLRLSFGLHAILPFLPDPYAADFTAAGQSTPGLAKARLTTIVGENSLALFLAPTGEEPLEALLPDGTRLGVEDEDEYTLRALFSRVVESEESPRPLQLLDLSGNADQFGVRTAFSQAPGWRPPLQILDMHLVADARNLRLIAPPQVQWEPVRTHPDDLRPGFPQPLNSKDDGGPLVMGIGDDTVHFAPIAPTPVIREMVAAAGSGTASAAIKFTLPFGIKAVAAIADDLPLARPSVALNQPLCGPLTGGLQISLRAANPEEGMPGGAIQTSNGPQGSNVLDDIAGFFNQDFHPSDEIARIPLTRIELSGYGASTSSQWVNKDAAPLEITKVEFEVLVGRTNVEVVEAQSILWPCMARVVRRITIRREGDGTVLRRDSGWVAATPGLFERPDCDCVFHLGPVLGMFEIREIRETTRRVRLSSNVELQAVYFDTDIALAHVVRGQGSEQQGPGGVRVGLVPTRRQLGFVQLINPDTPQKTPLTPKQLAELLTKHGPVGGPIDCEIDVDRSQQRMRVASLYSAVAPATVGDPQFAVAVYGALELPREGQWSVVRMRNIPLDSPEPEAVDSRLGVPLIRVGRMFTVGGNSNPFRFADPVDLLSPDKAGVDYALLLATQTFRVLFPRIKIRPGSGEITSDLAPFLADALAMTVTRALFPKLEHAISFPTNSYALKILGPGRLRLDPDPLTRTMPLPPRRLDLVKAAGVHAFTEYRGGDRHQTMPTKIELRFNSSAMPSWSLTIGPVSTVTRIDPFGPVMRLISTLEANSAGPPKATKPLIEYGGVLSPVEELITIMKEFGLPGEMLVETPNSSETEVAYKFKVAAKIELELAEIFGKTSGKLLVGLEVGSKRTQPAKFLAPASPSGQSLPIPRLDPLGSLELFAELEGTMTKPILGPICAGGLIRVEFIAGYDPSKPQPAKLELKLAAAVMISFGGDLKPKVLKAKGEIYYGYMLVLDYANGKVYPGVLLGFELEAEVPHTLSVTLKAEAIGLVKRLNAAQVLVKAELTFALEIEVFDLVDVEYSIEVEWEEKFPIVAVAALGLALGIPPVLPP